MARVFEDFLTAYCEHAEDSFTPPQFNTWAGLSIIAGALERRVWLPWSDSYAFYPNIYVLLVSKPGQGKSVCGNKAMKVLKEVSRKTGMLNIMPTQVTEAKFIELMGHGRSFIDTSSGKEITVFQNAGYYFASEASNSLRNIFGDFIACLTDFYDCPTDWERATKKDGKKIALRNVCMNLLGGSTFDYLGKLVGDENIQGGFASRLLYVVQRENSIKTQSFQRGHNDNDAVLRNKYFDALVADLTHISKLTGPMTATPQFGSAWETWWPEHQRKLQSYNSEKLQSILARTNTNVLKVSMLLSAAESDDRVMKLHHFEKAVSLVEALNAEVPEIFTEAKAAQGPRGGAATLPSAIRQIVGGSPGITQAQLRSRLNLKGYDNRPIDNAIASLLSEGVLGHGEVIAGKGVALVLKGESNDYL